MNRIRKSVLCALALTVSAGADAAPKFIVHGWDLSRLTPSEILANAEALDRTPYDGVSVTLPGSDRLMTDAGWTVGRFASEIRTMREFARHPSLRETLLFANLAPRTRLGWRDDAAWARAAANLRAAAAIAKAGGLRGVMGDIEDYWKAHQFHLQKDDPPFDEACRLARQRGAEAYRGFFAEYPDMLLLTFMYFSLDRAYSVSSDPAATMRERGDLLPSFLNGMLDVMPAGVRIVDGNETPGYLADALNRDFYFAAAVTRTHLLPLVAPENRDRYRAQVLVGFGLYLDGYTCADKASTWYMPPKDGSRLERLRANLDQAVDAADGYVWLYGEQHMFVDWKLEKPKTGWGAKTFTQGTWEEALPGLGSMLRCVKDPSGWMATEFGRKLAAGDLKNLVPDGTVHFPRIDSVFVEDVKGMVAGDYYAVRVSVPDATNAMSVAYWKTPEGKWNFPMGGNRVPLRLNPANGRQEGEAFIRVPGNVGIMGLQVRALSVEPGTEKDRVSVGVYRIRW